MPGQIAFGGGAAVARVALVHPGMFTAIDIAMWRDLRAPFERLQALPAIRKRAPRFGRG